MKVAWDRFTTLTATEAAQRFKLNSRGAVVAIKTTIVVWNLPAFSNLRMRIHADSSGSPGAVLHTSTNSYSLTDFTTQVFCMREVYFEFNPPYGVTLDTSLYYHLSLSADGYTGDGDHHLAWVKGWPDAPTVDPVVTLETLSRAPYRVSFIGAKR